MRNLWLLFLVGLTTGFLTEKIVSSQTSFTTDDLYIEGHTSGGLPIDDEDGDDDDGSGSGSGDYGFSIPDESIRRFLNVTRNSSSEGLQPLQPQPTTGSTHNPSTTAGGGQEESVTTKDNETTPFASPDGSKEDKELPDVGPSDEPEPKSTTPRSTIMPPNKTTRAKISVDISVTEETDHDNSLDRWNVATTKEEVLDKELANEIDAMAGRGSRLFDTHSPEEVTSENLWERTEVLAAVIACGVVGFLCAVFLLLLLGYRMKKKDEGSYDLGDTKLSTTAYHKAPTKEFYA